MANKTEIRKELFEKAKASAEAGEEVVIQKKKTKTAFKKGGSPGPGRPKGLTGIYKAREILNEEMPHLIKHAINMAYDGDAGVMRELIKIGIPKLNAAVNISVDAKHVDQQVAALFEDLKHGAISVHEALEATKTLKTINEIKEARETHQELLEKISKIEEAVEAES